jgi:transcriptional repressor NrdR
MRCPQCQGSSRVLESRAAEAGAAIRRRRECDGCGRRFTTYERLERGRLFVRKRNGRREAFDRAKLRSGLERAAHKRPVRGAQLDEIVSRIEDEADREGGELPAQRVGELCLEGLSAVDRISYLQFASVYKQLADLDEVRDELASLASQGRRSRSGPRKAAVSGRRSGGGSVRGAEKDSRLPRK